jgi:hypothetical protein
MLCGLPLGHVYDYLFLLGLTTSRGFHGGLAHGLDFHHLGMFTTFLVLVHYEEVWHVHGVLARERMSVRYLDGFTRPLVHVGVFVTQSHESVFPARPVCGCLGAHVLLRVLGGELAPGESRYH